MYNPPNDQQPNSNGIRAAVKAQVRKVSDNLEYMSLIATTLVNEERELVEDESTMWSIASEYLPEKVGSINRLLAYAQQLLQGEFASNDADAEAQAYTAGLIATEVSSGIIRALHCEDILPNQRKNYIRLLPRVTGAIADCTVIAEEIREAAERDLKWLLGMTTTQLTQALNLK